MGRKLIFPTNIGSVHPYSPSGVSMWPCDDGIKHEGVAAWEGSIHACSGDMEQITANLQNGKRQSSQ